MASIPRKIHTLNSDIFRPQNLLYFTTTKKLNWWTVWWTKLLASYNFQIYYQNGSENRQVNTLSWRLDLTTNEAQERLLFTGKEIKLVLDKLEIVTLYQSNPSKQKEVLARDQTKVISKHHNRSLLGHPGQGKKIELIQQNYRFLNIRRIVEEYIKQCTTCAQNKPTRHKPYSKQQQIKVS